jgi:hypothetical protein
VLDRLASEQLQPARAEFDAARPDVGPEAASSLSYVVLQVTVESESGDWRTEGLAEAGQLSLRLSADADVSGTGFLLAGGDANERHQEPVKRLGP